MVNYETSQHEPGPEPGPPPPFFIFIYFIFFIQNAYLIGIHASISIGLEIRCLPYAGFLVFYKCFSRCHNFYFEKKKINS